MNGTANALLTSMLSWMQGMAFALWQLLSGEEDGLLSWIIEHWVMLTVVLCVLGLVMDAVVHLIRWKPYLVWASFFRRLLHGNKKTQDVLEHMVVEEEHFVDQMEDVNSDDMHSVMESSSDYIGDVSAQETVPALPTMRRRRTERFRMMDERTSGEDNAAFRQQGE